MGWIRLLGTNKLQRRKLELGIGFSVSTSARDMGKQVRKEVDELKAIPTVRTNSRAKILVPHDLWTSRTGSRPWDRGVPQNPYAVSYILHRCRLPPGPVEYGSMGFVACRLHALCETTGKDFLFTL